MRNLERREPPDILVEKQDEWTEEYREELARKNYDAKGHWGHKDIREALKRDAQSKCSYCEATVEHVAYEHVDHVAPKVPFPDLSHEWTNLLLSCPRCNINKGKYWNPSCALLDPYTDDLAQHLVFYGTLVFHCVGSNRGEVTWRKLQLNRKGLVDARANRITAIIPLIDRWYEQEEGPVKDLLEEAVRLDLEEGEYTASVRAMLAARGFPL